jgi:hypothetical protein
MRIKILIINLFLTSSLLSDTIIFNDGLMIQGELIKVMKKHPYGPNTETEQAILFKVDKYNLNRVPKSLVINKTTDNVLMFDIRSIYKIEDDNGMLIYSSNKKWFSPRIFQKTTSDLEIFSTDLILSNGNDKIKIPLFSDISIALNNAVQVDIRTIRTIRTNSKNITVAQFKGIAIDTVSQKRYVLTSKAPLELTNINAIGSVSYENKALEGLLVGTGTWLLPGGLLLLIGEKAMGPDGIGFVFAGAGFILYSPINGMFKALDNWKVPIVKEFEINDSSWNIDLDSMLSNNKSVEQN